MSLCFVWSFFKICCWPCVRLLRGWAISRALWDFDVLHHLMSARQTSQPTFCLLCNSDCAAQNAVTPELRTVANSICILPWEILPPSQPWPPGWVQSNPLIRVMKSPFSTDMLNLEPTNKTLSLSQISVFIAFLFESHRHVTLEDNHRAIFENDV